MPKKPAAATSPTSLLFSSALRLAHGYATRCTTERSLAKDRVYDFVGCLWLSLAVSSGFNAASARLCTGALSCLVVGQMPNRFEWISAYFSDLKFLCLSPFPLLSLTLCGSLFWRAGYKNCLRGGAAFTAPRRAAEGPRGAAEGGFPGQPIDPVKREEECRKREPCERNQLKGFLCHIPWSVYPSLPLSASASLSLGLSGARAFLIHSSFGILFVMSFHSEKSKSSCRALQRVFSFSGLS